MPARAREQGHSKRHRAAIEHRDLAQALAEHGGDDALPVALRAGQRAQEFAVGDEHAGRGHQGGAFAAGERLDQNAGGEVEGAVRPQERVTGERAHHLLALFQIGLDVLVNLAGGERDLAAEGLAEADVADDVDQAGVADGGGQAGAPAAGGFSPPPGCFT